MHFFLLAAWFWMSANAYNMCRALTDVSLFSMIHLFRKILRYVAENFMIASMTDTPFIVFLSERI